MNRGKSKIVAGILALLIGWTGAHHYYLGSHVSGIITLVICGFGGLLNFVEGILILVMSDEDFDARYNQRAPEGLEFVFMKPK